MKEKIFYHRALVVILFYFILFLHFLAIFLSFRTHPSPLPLFFFFLLSYLSIPVSALPLSSRLGFVACPFHVHKHRLHAHVNASCILCRDETKERYELPDHHHTDDGSGRSIRIANPHNSMRQRGHKRTPCFSCRLPT